MASWREVRVRHAMQRDLRTLPEGWADAPGPPGVTFEGAGRRPDELVEALVSAYPPGHVDEIVGDPLAEETRIMQGRECGPLMDSSRFAVSGGKVVGAVLITDAPGNMLMAPGPLVADVFRHADPRWRGVGTALLRRGCAAVAAAGHDTLDLQVTDGNPAKRVYEALGFRLVATLSRP
jgi:GNAT superfamily N-acetyltransferase